MRKGITLSLTALALLALTVSPVFACGADKAETKQIKATTASSSCGSATTASMVGSKSACSADKSTTATTASAADCNIEACAKAHNMSVEECAAMCSSGKYEVKTVSIKGMTCGGCEGSVSAALAKVPGVVKVASVSYKDENAVVIVDKKSCGENADAILTKAVADKGYQAEIVPAVAKASGGESACGSMKATSASTTGKACNPAACASKKTAEMDPKDTK